MSEIYALLIGIDFYFGHTLPDGSFYPSLGGCVRDIRHVETYLTDPARLNLPHDHLLMLTSSDNRGAAPPEPAEQWPTYENIVAKFKELTAKAEPGDQLYIHYSGHGGRATTLYPDLKSETGVDEALVPLDIGSPQSRYLRDVELYYLIQEMMKKQLRVTVVFDCCHSGGSTRGRGGAVKRGISTVDTTVRPGESLVASPAELAAAWTGDPAGRTRGAKSASGWLLEPKGYTFFAACRASESSFEYPFNGRESNGALTYWMLDTLRQAGPNFTYKMVHDRILAKVHGQFEQQTPLLQGEGDLRVFGSERIPPHYAVPLLQVDSAGNRVRLNAGEAHGIDAGVQFAIFAHGTVDFSRDAERIALVEVTQVNATDAWAKILERNDQVALEAGAQALLLHSANLRMQRHVALIVDDDTLRQQLETAIATQGKGFVTVATDNQSDFQVALTAARAFDVWDPAGTPIPNLRPAIGIDEPNAVDRLVQRLVHLAKYQSVRDLAPPDLQGAQKLEVKLAAVANSTANGTGGAPLFRPGDQVKMVIKNTQPAGAANDPRRILNITVLDLASDWSVTQIYPAESADFEPLDPEKTIELEFEAYLPDGSSESLDTLKVFATQATTTFRWLELPALDQPTTHDTQKRSLISDPLEQLLAAVTAEETTTRAIRLTSGPQIPSWTVAQVELQVKA
ncbi:MAG: caspase family protein [Caldilineaceae bacterium]|nr:caspase family protein [Caldilineaceae bacterium]